MWLSLALSPDGLCREEKRDPAGLGVAMGGFRCFKTFAILISA